MPPKARPLLDRVIKGPGCWEWDGAHAGNGYAYACVGGRVVPAHRAVYEALVRPLEPDEEIDHLCLNHGCVRPGDDHTEPVTHQENVDRYIATRTHCVHGHERTPENSYTDYRGWRQCRVCKADWQRRNAK